MKKDRNTANTAVPQIYKPRQTNNLFFIFIFVDTSVCTFLVYKSAVTSLSVLAAEAKRRSLFLVLYVCNKKRPSLSSSCCVNTGKVP